MKLPDPITVIDDHIEIKLTPRESELFKLLVDNQGKLMTYGRLNFELWNEPDEHYASEMLAPLCKKLRDKIGAERVVTVRGRGYIYL